MTRTAWIALVLALGGLISVQHLGLERAPETRLEAPSKEMAGLPASDILPTYIASLFFGAFRAVAVDVLWIQLKKVEEEKRWYERREILELISHFQPRNPEVWSTLGWHSAYNVANGFTDPEKSWEWVKYGLDWLRKGNRRLPDSPYLKWEVAFTLFHKPSWQDGELDLPLLKRIEEDAYLQKELLPDGVAADRVRSAFELAILWLERARDNLLAAEGRHHLTQMGLYLYPSSMDGFIRKCMILQGMYEWQRNRPEEAKEWFRRAERQVRTILAGTYPENISRPILEDWAKFYARYPDLVDLAGKARSGRAEDERAFVGAVQKLLADLGPLDEGFFWMRGDPASLLNARKRKLARGQDEQECNDSLELAWDLNPGDLAMANLEPEGMDVDCYWLKVVEKDEHDAPPSQGRRQVRVVFARPPGAKVDLKVTVYDRLHKKLKETAIQGSQEFRFDPGDHGTCFIKVEPAGPVSPWPADTRYTFQYFLVD